MHQCSQAYFFRCRLPSLTARQCVHHAGIGASPPGGGFLSWVTRATCPFFKTRCQPAPPGPPGGRGLEKASLQASFAIEGSSKKATFALLSTMSSESSGCPACRGVHRAHTCGRQRPPREPFAAATALAQRMEEQDELRGLPQATVVWPPAVRTSRAMLAPDGTNGAAAAPPVLLPASAVARASTTAPPHNGGGTRAVVEARERPVASPGGVVATVNSSNLNRVVSAALFNHNAEVRLSHFRCRGCPSAVPLGNLSCPKCGAAAPTACNADEVAVRQRLRDNLSGCALAQRLTFFRQREQEQGCFAAAGCADRRAARAHARSGWCCCTIVVRACCAGASARRIMLLWCAAACRTPQLKGALRCSAGSMMPGTGWMVS